MVEGRLRVEGHFSRTGTQVYSDGMGGETIEYRPPEEVFAADSLASMRGMSATVRHPQGVGGRVTPQNWRNLAGDGIVVGQSGDHIAKADDGTHTQGPLWIHDGEAIRQVQSGELSELSVGYTAVLDETPGTAPDGQRYDARQTDIRGNHIALLGGGEARGGPTVRILDAEGHVRFDDDSDGPGRPEENRMKFTIHADGYPHEVEAADDKLSKALEKERNAHDDALKAAEKQAADAAKRADKAEGRADAAEEALASHPAVKAAEKQAREKLLADAKAIAGQDVTGDTPEAIRKAALVAKGVDVENKSDSWIEGNFAGLVGAETPRQDAADKMRGELKDDGGEIKLSPEDEALTSMGGR
jgi:hypothetical protein